ncbi:MAG: fatty acid synthase subunit beta domain-containing protein, partial [Myxococcota bacterium]
SAPIPTLLAFLEHLQGCYDREKAKKKAGQWGGKPLSFTWEFLSVEAAYHSPFMEPAYQEMMARVQEIGFSIQPSALKISVCSPATLEEYGNAEDLTEQIVREQCVMPVYWSEAIRKAIGFEDVGAVLDLGPGEGVARLTYSALKGAGVRVLPCAGAQGEKRFFELPLQPAPLDYRDFLPSVREGRIENRYTRATGQRPVLLPGMTPSTVDVGIVAAAANAGFTSELAGGGQVTEPIFWTRMRELAEALEPGREAVFNALYLDPYLWDLHVRKTGLVQKARRAGYPLCGVTISAGIPEVDEAVKWLDEFVSLGLWLNALKPGTVAQVRQVVKIAQAVPHHTLFLHLEGGKAGGHHSWEDLDQLLLDSYHLIREQPNLILCVGGGIADEARGLALLNGSWSEAYGCLPMPVDAIFLGTLTMACLEATTSPQVKQALVDAAGTKDWVFAGGVQGQMTSGKSALNADIHYVDNAASRCGRLLDQVAGDEDAVQAKRAQIIEALNATAKPYFGDLEQMSYADVLRRMIDLMAIGRGGVYEDGIWLDVSYRTRVADFLRRAEARLSVQQEGTFASVLQKLEELDRPEEVLSYWLEAYPQAEHTVLHPLDVRFFLLQICRRPGKPVNFVPCIDANVRRWYKSDSLWQAHDDRWEADQVLIIPGPEAVKGLRSADEPVASMLGRFEQAVVEEIQAGAEEVHAGEEFDRTSRTPNTQISSHDWFPAWCVGELQHSGALQLVAQTPEREEDWLTYVRAQFSGTLVDCLVAHRWYSGKSSQANPVRPLCRARAGSTLHLEFSPEQKELHALTYHPQEGSSECVRIVDNGQGQMHMSVSLSEREQEALSLRVDVLKRAEGNVFVLADGHWADA